MLCVVKNEVRNNNFNQIDKLIEGLIIFKSDFVLLSDITCEVAYVFMTPWGEIFLISLQKIVKTCSGSFLSEDHRKYWQKVSIFNLKLKIVLLYGLHQAGQQNGWSKLCSEFLKTWRALVHWSWFLSRIWQFRWALSMRVDYFAEDFRNGRRFFTWVLCLLSSSPPPFVGPSSCCLWQVVLFQSSFLNIF